MEKEGYNPIDIFCLDVPFGKTDLRKAYHKMVRLLHPDKSWNNERFCRMFTIVNDNYKLLLEPEKKKVCVRAKSTRKTKAKKQSKKDLMKLLYDCCDKEEKIIDDDFNKADEDLRLVIWKPLEIIKYENNIQKRNIKIVSNISMTGAERQIVNHQFLFTDNISVTVV